MVQPPYVGMTPSRPPAAKALIPPKTEVIADAVEKLYDADGDDCHLCLNGSSTVLFSQRLDDQDVRSLVSSLVSNEPSSTQADEQEPEEEVPPNEKVFLRTIDLSQNCVSRDGCVELSRLWKEPSTSRVLNCSNIQNLKLADNEIGLRGCQAIAQLLAHFQLQFLDLSGNPLTGAGFMVLAGALSSNHSLQVLKLNRVDISGLKPLQTLSMRIREHAQLHHVELADLKFPPSCLDLKSHSMSQFIGERIFGPMVRQKVGRPIDTLNISKLFFEERGFGLFLDNVYHVSDSDSERQTIPAALQIVNQCELADGGREHMTRLVDVAQRRAVEYVLPFYSAVVAESDDPDSLQSAVERLSVRCNRLALDPHTSGYRLLRWVVLGASLRSLDLSGNRIGDDGMQMVSYIVLLGDSLEALNVQACGASCVGLTSLARSLMHGSSRRLSCMLLWGNHIEPATATAIHMALEQRPTLLTDLAFYEVDGQLYVAEKTDDAVTRFNEISQEIRLL